MFFIILFLVQCLPLINSEMIEYHDHLVFPNRPEYIIIPKFDKSDVPHWAPGKGRSYIDLSDLNIRTACGSKVPPVPSGVDACRPASLDILMMKAPKDTHWTNYWPDNEFCCTSDAVDAGK